jgi:hypothetical protein
MQLVLSNFFLIIFQIVNHLIQFLKDNPDTTFLFNEWMKWHGNQIEQALINMIKDDEELGLYDETTKCYCASYWGFHISSI